MPQWIARIRPYVLLVVFLLPALWPLLNPALPRTNDNLTHFYRAVALDALVQAGIFFPRWSPDLVLGYGYPIFNYFPYLGHWHVELWHLLGFNFFAAYQLASAVVLVLAAWGAFRLGRDHFGPNAGLIAGVAYAYSPYLLYDTYIRGSLPETQALACLPFVLLGLRHVVRGSPRATLPTALALAAAIFSHEGVTLQVAPFVGLYTLGELWAHAPRPLWRTLLHLAGVGLLAFGLTAFHALPALGEARYVQIERGTLNGAMSYVNNFLSLAELWMLPRLPVDPALLNPPVARTISQLAGLLALGAALPLVARSAFAPLPTATQKAILHLIFTALGMFLFILPLAKPLWDAVPLLQVTLFPWRLLGPLSLWLALLAGAAIVNLQHLRLSPAPLLPFAPAITLAFFIVLGLPFASPLYEAVPHAPTLRDLAAFEAPPFFIGTTTVGEYLPVWVKELPATQANQTRLLNGEPLPPFEALPAGVTVETLHTAPVGGEYRITTAAPLTLTYRAFYFPTWQATLNAAPLPLTATVPTGLLTFALPAGTATVKLEMGLTPLQQFGNLLSLLAVALCVAYGLWLMANGKWQTNLPSTPAPLLPISNYFFLLALTLALFRPLLYDAGYTPLLQKQQQVGWPLNVDFSGELTLLSWEAPRLAVGADEAALLNFYWRANHPLGVPYAFDVRLVDAAGRTWSELDPQRPRDWRFTPGTDHWTPDQYILDPYLVRPLAGTPPGEYTVQVTAFSRYDLRTIGQVAVGTLTLTAPSQRPCATPPLAQWDTATLQAAVLEVTQAVPGEDVVAALCWEQTALGPEATGSLRLQGPTRTLATQAFTLARPFALPTAATVRDQFTLHIPADAASGVYTWTLEYAGKTVPLGLLQVNAPARTFTAPAVGQVVEADLGPIRLYGATLPAAATPGAPLAVSLVWAADQTPDRAYKVFVHLLAPDGTLLAQSDAAPAQWTRPTTGWLPGEFITDPHTLILPPDAPPGPYTIAVGLYSGADRLTAPDFPEGRVVVGGIGK